MSVPTTHHVPDAMPAGAPARVSAVLPGDACEPLVPLGGTAITCRRHPVRPDPFHRAEGCAVWPSVLCVLCASRTKELRRWVTRGYSVPCTRCGRLTTTLSAAGRGLRGGSLPVERTRALSAAVHRELERVRGDLVAEVLGAGAAPFLLGTARLERATLRTVAEPPASGDGPAELLDPSTRYVTLARWTELVTDDVAPLAARLRARIEPHTWTWESVALRALPAAWFEDLVAADLEAERADARGPWSGSAGGGVR
jgi:hypothetical protein